MDISRKVIIVTGGTGLLGSAICKGLASYKAKVVLQYHTNERKALALVKEIERAGGESNAIGCDLTQLEQISLLYSHALKCYGRVDAIINSASIFTRVPFTQVDMHRFDYDHTLHQKVPFFLSQYMYSHIRELESNTQRGCVINMVDTGVYHPRTSRPSYYCSKAALIEQTRIVALAVAPHIRINAIAPGAIMSAQEEDEQYFDSLRKTNPLQRIATTQEILHTILFLLCNEAITGQTINVDCGEHLQ